jgi:mannosyltransferase OCH1-like enzyme
MNYIVGMGIPKITHQTWLQGWDKLPDKFKVNVDDLHNMNPDYTHMQWDEKSLREECMKIGPEVAAKFDEFPYLVQKVDLGRYVVVYNHGGITVDTDMKSLRSVSNTPNIDTADMIVSYSAFPANMLGIFNNAMIFAKPHHPALHELIQTIVESSVKESDFPNKEMYINATTAFSKFNKIVNAHKDTIVFLDHKYFEPCFSVDPVCKPTSASIMDHKHELSWFNGYTKILAKILIVILYLLVFVVIPVVWVGWLARSTPFMRGIFKWFRR